MATDSKYYTIGVLNKAFSVIEMMTTKTNWGLSELAKACGLPKGTLQRILLTLCELDYVWQESKGSTYSLTLKFLKFGRSIAANSGLIGQAQPTCRKLMETVNETVNLCMIFNTDVVVVDQQVSWQSLRLDSIIGSSFPIYRSASGKTYSAFLDEKAFLQLVKEIRQGRNDITDEDINFWRQDMARIRKFGLGFDCEEVFAGVRCVAAPIFDYTGNIIATIGCSVPTVRITEESSKTLTDEVSRSASKISQLLGALPYTFSQSTHTMLQCPID